MLYSVSRSPYQCDLASLLRLVTPQDDILFLQDGVVALVKKGAIYNLMLSQLKNLFVLENDLVARGLRYQISDHVEVINYHAFVDLTTKHRQYLAW
ncbi:sulfurtransferase complex subunit TusB [Candidatus Fukatsuia symbiotica]|uniref:Sulfurtransferase TusB n=1 Tax=Candidatus Fukatsuia symbiotica TaxID=1878942 RepID=A0A2U8I6P6_9GAMM|nr:sulfurtransferase complex subunit TusB [Candidatus Fukatsuia symbiotica]AWK14853.1 sulfurtransferase TusB [Candidatus Fukatsuia symbiotica]MEA9445195.1 sulfurtransferase complex subunit TusB [Candidatus Fukatsuia symbiotica]